MFKPACVLACIMQLCACACMRVCAYACMHLVCAHECKSIYISFASVWIHVPLQVCYLPLMYVCAVHFDTFCLLCPVSYLEHACCYFVFLCNRCNKEHFELELELDLRGHPAPPYSMHYAQIDEVEICTLKLELPINVMKNLIDWIKLCFYVLYGAQVILTRWECDLISATFVLKIFILFGHILMAECMTAVTPVC